MDATIPNTQMAHPAIQTWDQLNASLDQDRTAGRRIVFTNGCFDILHPGHVDIFARARSLGDVLVVGVNSSESVARIKPGQVPARPLNTLGQRMFVLAHLSAVSYVTSFDQDTPYELISLVQPDVLVKGGDWAVDKIVGRDIVEARGGSVYSLPLLQGYSTTGLINSIRSA